MCVWVCVHRVRKMTSGSLWDVISSWSWSSRSFSWCGSRQPQHSCLHARKPVLWSQEHTGPCLAFSRGCWDPDSDCTTSPLNHWAVSSETVSSLLLKKENMQMFSFYLTPPQSWLVATLHCAKFFSKCVVFVNFHVLSGLGLSLQNHNYKTLDYIISIQHLDCDFF